MSGLMDGINNVHSITAQINNLKADALQDPEAFEYTLQQNFNQMITDLISSIGYEEEEDDKENKSYINYDLLPVNYNLNIEDIAAPDSSDFMDLTSFLNSNQSNTAYLESLHSLQNNTLALQGFLGQI